MLSMNWNAEMTNEEDVFVHVISKLRKLSAVELEELSKQAAVTVHTLCNWMTGKTKTPKKDTLYRVATALKIRVVKSNHLRLIK